jgi:hypothetical protein
MTEKEYKEEMEALGKEFAQQHHELMEEQAEEFAFCNHQQ